VDAFAEIADERRGLAALLSELTGEQQATQSLCRGWTVHDVAAHLVVPLEVSTPKFVLAMLACRGNFDRANVRLTRQQARRPLGEAVSPIRLKTVSANVFTHPEIATVGVQEKALTEDGDVEVVRLPLATNARAKMGDLHDGFVKLYCRRSTDVVIGGVVVAPTASELILPITLAVTKGLTAGDLANTFAIYPSLSGSITEAGRRLMGIEDEHS